MAQDRPCYVPDPSKTLARPVSNLLCCWYPRYPTGSTYSRPTARRIAAGKSGLCFPAQEILPSLALVMRAWPLLFGEPKRWEQHLTI